MTELNKEYVLAIFKAVQQAAATGTYAVVPDNAPEVAALVKAKYIKTNKKLHNEGGNVAAVIVDGANEADLRVDFEIADFPATETAPVAAPFAAEPAPTENTDAGVPEVLPEVTTAPPFAEYVPENATAPTFEPAPLAAPQEQFQPMAAQAAPAAAAEQPQAEQTVLAPVVEVQGGKMVGADDHVVAAVAQTKNGEVEIDIGVPFAFKVSKTASRKNGAGLAAYAFDDIADYKIKNPTTVPSFHTDKKTSEVSNPMRRANERYAEANSTVTFRSATVDETDPKGAGTRVYALFTSEAPPLKKITKKDNAAESQTAE